MPRPENIGTTTFPGETSIPAGWRMTGRGRDEGEQRTRKRHDKREPEFAIWTTNSGEGSSLRASDGRIGPLSLLHGLRRHSVRRPPSLYERCPACTTSRTDPHQTHAPFHGLHRAHNLFPGENYAQQSTRHVVGFHRRNSHLWECFRSTGPRNPHKHQRPAVYSNNYHKFPSIRVQGWSNLLASGSN